MGIFALQGVPEQTRGEFCLFGIFIETLFNLGGRIARERPGAMTNDMYPKIACRTAVVQTLNGKRLGKIGVVSGCERPVQRGRDDGHHPGFINEREIKIICEMGILKAKSAVFINELPVFWLHRSLLFLPRRTRRSTKVFFVALWDLCG